MALPFLPTLRPLLSGGLALLLAGCGTLPFTSAKGRIGKIRYDRDQCPLADRGRIAVYFDPKWPLCRPATEWRLVTTDGPKCWHRVTGKPVFRAEPADVYGIQFQMCDPKTPHEAPPSGTVTLLEKQRLHVPIYYR